MCMKSLFIFRYLGNLVYWKCDTMEIQYVENPTYVKSIVLGIVAYLKMCGIFFYILEI